MTTFFIEQFGCRATQADAAAIERQLLEHGNALSAEAAAADVVIVNTCTVTAAADLQARQAIHSIHQTNPAARIVVTGCYAQRAPDELAGLDGVSWVVGNSHRPEIPQLIASLAPSPAPRTTVGFVPLSSIKLDDAVAAARTGEIPLARPRAQVLRSDIQEQTEFTGEPIEGGEAGHTRPVLKIQDGCDKRCSYCVIPLVRGRSRSLAPDRVVQAIVKLVHGGAREVVLSGIDLGNYGRDLSPRTDLAGVLDRILHETPLERLRISSIEPIDVSEDLIALFLSNDRLAQHFHMPLQSGADTMLAAMHRWYRAEHYARRAELVRKLLPDAAIGADVIAGFPGETEEHHRATLALIERLPLTYLHVFSFSPRPGTAAAELQDQVSHAVIARRARELRIAGEEKKAAFRAAQLGRTLHVLTLNGSGEDAAGPWTRAVSGNYLDVRVTGVWPANQFLDIAITGTEEPHATGRAI